MAIARTSIEDCVTEGERLIFIFFKDKLPDEYTFWSNLEIAYGGQSDSDRKERELDFLVYHDVLGLFLFSVKDWRIEQIESIENNLFYLRDKGEPQKPIGDLRNQFIFLKGFLQRKYELTDLGKILKFPITFNLFFPYIKKIDFEKKINEFGSAITEKGFINFHLFKDFIESDYFCRDKYAAKNFFDNLRSKKFDASLDADEKGCLDDILTSFRGGKTKYVNQDYKESAYKAKEPAVAEISPAAGFETIDDDIFISIEDILIKLDKEQVNTANSFLEHLIKKPGHLILKGTAGSGKTIILLQMFYKLLKRDGENCKIAYISRQHSLAHDFSSKLKERAVDIKDPDCFIGVFHEYFQLFFREEYQKLPLDKNNFPTGDSIKEFIENNIDRIPQYFDFAFIDEGHNLPDEWIKFIVKSVKGREHGKVIYTEDQDQNIYGITRDFGKACIDTAVTKVLKINYRNTYEIYHFAVDFCDKPELVKSVNADIEGFAKIRKGRVPEIFSAAGGVGRNEEANLWRRLFLNTGIYRNIKAKEIAKKVFDRFKDWQNEGFRPGEVALIYPMLGRGKGDCLLLFSILDIFIRNNFLFRHSYAHGKIMTKFPDKYYPSVVAFDSGESSRAVNLITAMSSQGISYKCVILVLDGFESITWFGEQEIINMLYTGVTRPTHELLLVSLVENKYSRKAAGVVGAMNKNCE